MVNKSFVFSCQSVERSKIFALFILHLTILKLQYQYWTGVTHS